VIFEAARMLKEEGSRFSTLAVVSEEKSGSAGIQAGFGARMINFRPPNLLRDLAKTVHDWCKRRLCGPRSYTNACDIRTESPGVEERRRAEQRHETAKITARRRRSSQLSKTGAGPSRG